MPPPRAAGAPSATVCTLNSANTCDMGQSSINAIKSLIEIHRIPPINIGVTPMIGMNDVPTSVFRITDVNVLAQYVVTTKIGYVHFWSFDRDRDCPVGAASPTCNSMGLNLGPLAFYNAFYQALYVGVNPCTTNNGGCSPDATCTNTNGQAVCACKSGWTGDGRTCSEWPCA